jgi:ABC-2 type transport system ATP-binding protein
MNPMDSPLFCRGVHKRYGSQAVLRGVDLRIPAGAVMGLLGRNGAGKSTLMRILTGLMTPDEGSATLLGEPALELTDAARVRLGFVPQQADSFAWMRVGDMLALVASFYPVWDQPFVDEQLRRWQIDAAKPLARLSPGERQRVALVRALAPRPSLLILDEPAAALDPVARRDLLREIAGRAADAQTTVLFSTHIVSDLERVASHVAFLHEGRLLLDTSLDDLRDRHGRLFLPPSLAEPARAPLEGELRRRHRPDGSLQITLARAPGADWPALAAASGARLDALTLEDLFIEVAE